MSYNYGEGTPGFTPLELYSMSDADTKRYKPMGKLGSATNIWSLGASLISICNRDPEPKTDFYSPEMAIPRFNDNAQHFYSQELRDLLSACVRYRGDDRIGAQDLLDSISRLTAGPEAGPDDADLANGLREGYSMIAGAEPIWQPSIKERYRTGMSYAEGEEGRLREEQEDADKAQEEKERRKKEAADAKAAAAKAEKEVAKGAVKGKPGKKKKQKK
jgi:serine/threonine protein kinase